MGGGIDTAGEARDDGIASSAQIGGQLFGHAGAERGGIAGADERDEGAVQQGYIAQGPEDCGGVVQIVEGCGVARLAPYEQPRTIGTARF